MRKTLSAFKDRLRRTTSSTYRKVVLAAVILVPLLYGALYLKAFWDPYENMANLPVAVVNQDSGYHSSSTNENVGNELVKELKNNDQVGWKFVDAKTAEKGLNDKKYYAEIIVPSDFSQKVYSVDTPNPSKAELVYRSRVANNFLADTILSNVAKRVGESLSHDLSAKYINNIFSSLRSTGDSLQTAATASSSLASGLGTISTGSVSLNTGINTALSGSSQITVGLQNIKTGQDNLTDGLNLALDSTKALQAGANTILGGLTSMQTSLSNAVTAINTANSGISTGQSALSQVDADLKACETKTCTTEELETMRLTVAGVNSGLSQAHSGLTQVSAGLNDAATSTTTGTPAMIKGQKDITTGLGKLSVGTQTALDGSKQLSAGTSQLIAGSRTLNSGLGELSIGSTSLTSGVNSAASGATQLSTSLSSGAKTIESATNQDKTTKQTAVMSSPINVKTDSYDIVPNYGSGFAPYFISLSLWVGGIMAFFVVDFKKKTVGRRAAVAKYLTLVMIGTVQAVLLAVVLKDMLGLRVVNVAAYYGFIVLTSWSFMAFLQLLIQHLDDAGRYIAVVLLILQLAACAGTFPKELIPGFFQVINPLMPMTYTVQALRSILYTQALSQAIMPTLVILGILVVSLALNLFITKRKKTLYYKYGQKD